MNRQIKRATQRQKQPSAERAPAARRPMPDPRRTKRVGPRQFLKEVRQELRKVDWPRRKEMFAYTVVVLVTVIVLTSFVFVLDMLISRGVLAVFGGQSG